MKILRKSEIIRGSQQTITNRSEKEKLVEREREREYETLALSLARLQRVQRPCIIISSILKQFMFIFIQITIQ